RLLGPEGVVADQAERLGQGGVVVTAVVGGAHDRLDGEGVGGKEVAAADLGGVEAELVGGHVEHPFEEGGGLGPPGAAEGAHRGGVGGDGGDVVRDPGDPVGALGHELGGPPGQPAAETGVGAAV